MYDPEFSMKDFIEGAKKKVDAVKNSTLSTID